LDAKWTPKRRVGPSGLHADSRIDELAAICRTLQIHSSRPLIYQGDTAMPPDSNKLEFELQIQPQHARVQDDRGRPTRTAGDKRLYR